MKSVNVKIHYLNIGREKYSFILNMLAAIKCEEKYGNFAEIFNGLLTGDKFYKNAFKMLSCACVEKEWDYEELAKEFSINFPQLKRLDEIVNDMYTDFEAFKAPEETKGNEKNEMASQS
jgi:hypothetical protein